MSQLRDYQREIVQYLGTKRRCNLFVPMGLGKTVSTLTAIDLLQFTEDVLPALVIAPLRVAQNTWPDEVKKWPHLRHLRVSAIVGSALQREAALHAPADIYTINYENLVWLVDTLAGACPFRMVVADECSKLKGFRTKQGTKRAHALASFVHHEGLRYVGLTGTPAGNGLEGLWAINWFVDRGMRLGKSFNAFSQRWFRPDRSGFGIEPLPHAQREIEIALADVCLSLAVRDYFDIREPIRNYIRVQLPPKARAQYEAMEDDMYLKLGEHEIEAFGAAGRTLKCLQLANGAAYLDPEVENEEAPGARKWVEIHDAKLQALESVIEEAAGMPVLVAYHFKSDLARLKKAFPKGRELDRKPQTMRDWNDGKIPVLFAHPASAGHGINLQSGGNILVFFGLNWNLEEHQQIIERIGPVRQAQAGFDRPVFLHYIIADRTVDDLVLERLDSKREVQDILLAAMKRRTAK